ncbi:Golgin subfamily A member 6-like protein 1 [Striga asiatica]|uniref:Golgin subfamily A member 6-like protein 1 n=1 Tax=Striga asiatica TaxID=4170 RepID=A0A5A7QXJ5_STRAF|nr:Golgin subfamily A member 6-like protein 1 [Striga asiatica]
MFDHFCVPSSTRGIKKFMNPNWIGVCCNLKCWCYATKFGHPTTFQINLIRSQPPRRRVVVPPQKPVFLSTCTSPSHSVTDDDIPLPHLHTHPSVCRRSLLPAIPPPPTTPPQHTHLCQASSTYNSPSAASDTNVQPHLPPPATSDKSRRQLRLNRAIEIRGQSPMLPSVTLSRLSGGAHS